MRKFTAVLCAGASAMAMLVPAAASAQAIQDPQNAGDPQEAAPAEDPTIIVTAQRRDQSVQETSLAVVALSGEDLIERGASTLQDLQYVSPSFSFADAGLLKFANIRGIGLNLQSPTVVSGVATYRDGLFAPSPLFLNEGLFDIASVEVLRGPQGTFVGQNSTGGAILQNSVSPQIGSNSTTVGAVIGNYDTFELDVGMTLPVSDTIAVRLAGALERRDSFYDNLGPARITPGRIKSEHLRVGVLWEPTADFNALLKTELNFGDYGGYPQQPIPGTRYAPLDPPDVYTFNYDRRDVKREEFSLRSSLETNYYFGDGFNLRGIFGYQYGFQNFINDSDASPSPEQYLDQTINDNVYSAELNLISPDADRFSWVLGGSVVYQTADLDLTIFLNRPPFGTIFPIQRIIIDSVNPKTSAGVFAQGSFDVTDTVTIEAGGRFSYDRQTQEGTLTLSPTPPLPGVLDASSPVYDDTHLTGKLAVEWQPTPDHLFFAFVANGFKAGGVNLPAGVFESEKVVDYELGWKGTLAGGAITTQLNGFYMDYRDLQLNVFDPNTNVASITNIGESEIYGVEAQLQLREGGFTGSANVAYVKSSLGELTLIDERALPGGSGAGLGPPCPPGVASNPPICFNYDPFRVTLDGRRNPYAPEFTANGYVSYEIALGDGFLTPQVNVAYIGEQTANIFERAGIDILEERVLVGANLTYAIDDYSFTAYVTNIFDEVYRTGNSGNNTYYGAPRQFGLRFGASF